MLLVGSYYNNSSAAPITKLASPIGPKGSLVVRYGTPSLSPTDRVLLKIVDSRRQPRKHDLLFVPTLAADSHHSCHNK